VGRRLNGFSRGEVSYVSTPVRVGICRVPACNKDYVIKGGQALVTRVLETGFCPNCINFLDANHFTAVDAAGRQVHPKPNELVTSGKAVWAWMCTSCYEYQVTGCTSSMITIPNRKMCVTCLCEIDAKRLRKTITYVDDSDGAGPSSSPF